MKLNSHNVEKSIGPTRWRALGLLFVSSLILACTTNAPLPTPPEVLQSISLRSDNTNGNALKITYLGNTTLGIEDEESRVVVDAFVTRPSRWEMLAGIKPNKCLIRDVFDAAGMPSADLIVPLHSHYDHLMDAPVAADVLGAKLVASPSVRSVFRNMRKNRCVDVDEDTTLIDVPSVEEERKLRMSAFELEFEEAQHTDTGISGRFFAPRRGQAKASDFNVPAYAHRSRESAEVNYCEPTPASNYREGTSYNLYFYHRKSDLRIAIINAAPRYDDPDELMCEKCSDLHPLHDSDVIFIHILLFDKVTQNDFYLHLKEVLKKKRTKTILVPVHWDAFYIPITKDTVKLRRQERLRMTDHPMIARSAEYIDKELGSLPKVEIVWITAFDTMYIY